MSELAEELLRAGDALADPRTESAEAIGYSADVLEELRLSFGRVPRDNGTLSVMEVAVLRPEAMVVASRGNHLNQSFYATSSTTAGPDGWNTPGYVSVRGDQIGENARGGLAKPLAYTDALTYWRRARAYCAVYALRSAGGDAGEATLAQLVREAERHDVLDGILLGSLRSGRELAVAVARMAYGTEVSQRTLDLLYGHVAPDDAGELTRVARGVLGLANGAVLLDQCTRWHAALRRLLDDEGAFAALARCNQLQGESAQLVTRDLRMTIDYATPTQRDVERYIYEREAGIDERLLANDLVGPTARPTDELRATIAAAEEARLFVQRYVRARAASGRATGVMTSKEIVHLTALANQLGPKRSHYWTGLARAAADAIGIRRAQLLPGVSVEAVEWVRVLAARYAHDSNQSRTATRAFPEWEGMEAVAGGVVAARLDAVQRPRETRARLRDIGTSLAEPYAPSDTDGDAVVRDPIWRETAPASYTAILVRAIEAERDIPDDVADYRTARYAETTSSDTNLIRLRAAGVEIGTRALGNPLSSVVTLFPWHMRERIMRTALASDTYGVVAHEFAAVERALALEQRWSRTQNDVSLASADQDLHDAQQWPLVRFPLEGTERWSETLERFLPSEPPALPRAFEASVEQARAAMERHASRTLEAHTRTWWAAFSFVATQPVSASRNWDTAIASHRRFCATALAPVTSEMADTLAREPRLHIALAAHGLAVRRKHELSYTPTTGERLLGSYALAIDGSAAYLQATAIAHRSTSMLAELVQQLAAAVPSAEPMRMGARSTPMSLVIPEPAAPSAAAQSKRYRAHAVAWRDAATVARAVATEGGAQKRARPTNNLLELSVRSGEWDRARVLARATAQIAVRKDAALDSLQAYEWTARAEAADAIAGGDYATAEEYYEARLDALLQFYRKVTPAVQRQEETEEEEEGAPPGEEDEPDAASDYRFIQFLMRDIAHAPDASRDTERAGVYEFAGRALAATHVDPLFCSFAMAPEDQRALIGEMVVSVALGVQRASQAWFDTCAYHFDADTYNVALAAVDAARLWHESAAAAFARRLPDDARASIERLDRRPDDQVTPLDDTERRALAALLTISALPTDVPASPFSVGETSAVARAPVSEAHAGDATHKLRVLLNRYVNATYGQERTNNQQEVDVEGLDEDETYEAITRIMIEFEQTRIDTPRDALRPILAASSRLAGPLPANPQFTLVHALHAY